MTNTWWRATLSQAVSSRVLAGTWSKTAWSAAACAGDLWVHRQCFTSEPSINPPIGMTFTKTALSENKANYTRIAPCCVTTTPSLSLANIHGNAGYALLEVAAYCVYLLKAVPFQASLGRHLPQTADHHTHVALKYTQQAIPGEHLPLLPVRIEHLGSLPDVTGNMQDIQDVDDFFRWHIQATVRGVPQAGLPVHQP